MKSSKRLMNSKKRYLYIMGIVYVFSLITLGRYGWLQLVRGDELYKLNKEAISWKASIKNPRGSILDRDGIPLAVSLMTGSLCVDPKIMMEKGDSYCRSVAKMLSPVLNINEEEIYKKFVVKESRFQWVKRLLEPKEEEAVKNVIKDNKLEGLYFEQESKRYYPKKEAAAQVLGFVGTDDKGGSGIEYLLDKHLKGTTSFELRTYNAKQQRIYDDNVRKPVEKKLPEVTLTIDSHMQYVVEQVIDEAVAKFNAKGAAAIIMDPYTGEILSMVSRPTFDPNKYGDFSPTSWSNKGVTMMYEPGSVFKPIVGCIGMQRGLIDENTQFYDGGRIRVDDKVFQNWDGEGKGYVVFSDIIKDSVNTGMIELGQMIGKKSMVAGTKEFGFGSATGVDLPGEADGILYDEDMYGPDLASFSIGQGIAVTPLQELRAICAIANGGELLKPYIVKSIVGADGKIVKEGKKEVVRNVITEEVSRKMRLMMEKVVKEGGGKRAAINGYRIAGKTGTAEKKAENGRGYAAGEYIASFVGFVPADKPKYAMLVMVDTPHGINFYGGQVAAPIFRDVLQQILVLKGIQPTEPDALESLVLVDHQNRNLSVEIRAVSIEKNSAGELILPDFKGLSVSQVMVSLERVGLKLRPYGVGCSYKQMPPPGTAVKQGSVVEVWLR